MASPFPLPCLPASPLLFVASAFFGELWDITYYPYLWHPAFQALYILSALFAFLVTFFTFL